jgi:hypothetical protein
MLQFIGFYPAVPIFNIDKRPFALLCAYNTSDQPKRFVSLISSLSVQALSQMYSSKVMNYHIYEP